MDFKTSELMRRLPILFIMLALLGAYGCGNKQQQSQNMVADSTHADSMPAKDTTTVDTVPVADTIKALPPDTNVIYRDFTPVRRKILHRGALLSKKKRYLCTLCLIYFNCLRKCRK